jgi:DNA-binding transcriptional LysR family regulator
VSLADLRSLPMLLSERAAIHSLYDAIIDALRQRDIEPKVIHAPPSFAGVAQLVAAGAGWVAVLDSVRNAPPSGTVLRRVRDLDATMEVHIIRRARDEESLAAAFVRCVSTHPDSAGGQL